MAGTLKNYFTNVNLIPKDEKGRIEALNRYAILDTPPENTFNNIVRLACSIFQVPIALVSLVDEERVFLKANKGMPGVLNTERGMSLCSLAILTDDVTVFENALKEACLLSNPLITGNFGLRFYAAAPLITSDGYNIGSLCILDKHPRKFSESEKESLENLAAIVMDEIELRLSSIKAISLKQELLDITRQKNEDLIIKNEDLDHFIHSASHDLKAPVSSIEGLVNILNTMLEKIGTIEPEIPKAMELIYESIDKFKKTITDLSEISKIQKASELMTDVDIAEVISDIEILISDLITQSQGSIHKSLKCPNIKFSKINLQSILINLISNSLKYRSERKPVIWISSEVQGDYVKIQVKDNGRGIERKHFSIIFEMFKRVNYHVEGSGIGLYLVKRIVDQSNGKIDIESEENEGTTFTVYLPLID